MYVFVSLAVLSKSSRIVVKAEVILASNVCSDFDLSSIEARSLGHLFWAKTSPFSALCVRNQKVSLRREWGPTGVSSDHGFLGSLMHLVIESQRGLHPLVRSMGHGTAEKVISLHS